MSIKRQKLVGVLRYIIMITCRRDSWAHARSLDRLGLSPLTAGVRCRITRNDDDDTRKLVEVLLMLLHNLAEKWRDEWRVRGYGRGIWSMHLVS